jgi:hypothetical protein
VANVSMYATAILEVSQTVRMHGIGKLEDYLAADSLTLFRSFEFPEFLDLMNSKAAPISNGLYVQGCLVHPYLDYP